MFKQLFKLTFITFIWSKYKRIIVSTILLFAFFWLTHKVHADFLTYSELKKSQDNIGLSYVIKWVVLLCSIALYFIYNHFSRSTNTSQSRKKPHLTTNTDDDPFAEIRKKDTLKSTGDFIIEGNNKRGRKK